MRRLLHAGAHTYEIGWADDLAPIDPAGQPPDREAAVAALRRAGREEPGRMALRRLVEERLPGTGARLDDDAILERVAGLVRSGWLVLRERPHPPLGSVDLLEAESGAPQPTEARRLQVERTWVEIQLLGEDDLPIPGERYRIDLPDGSVREGRLDQNGLARVDGIDPGECTVTFPALDEEAWVSL